jgi:Hypothetical protein (DUF2513)
MINRARRRCPDVRRDIELIRTLLTVIEGEPKLNRCHEISFSDEFFCRLGREENEIVYHLLILHEAGFIAGNPETPSVTGMTSTGHDFLACIKSEMIWTRTRTRLTGLPDAALRTYSAVAEDELNKEIGLGS